MKLRRDYTAREIAAMSDEELNSLPEGGLLVKYDDGVVVKSKTFKTIYVAPIWEFIVKHGGKLVQKHSLCRMVNGEYIESLYTSSTHLSLCENAFWDTFYSGEASPKRFWEMSEDIYLATNRIYNFNTIYDGRYMSTMSLEDVIEVMRHPKIRQYKKDWLEGKISIEECHDNCYHVLETDTEYFKDNDIHMSVRAKLLSKTQVKQMIGPRGNVPDVNGEAYPHVIEAGYYERLNYAYDSIVDSKSASIGLYMQGGPLEDSEYNNRCCQLGCSFIRRVEYRDCGTSEVFPTYIKSKEMLRHISGKNIVIKPEGNQAEAKLSKGKIHTISKHDNHLIGTTVYVRATPGCMEEEQGVVCSTCLGQTSFLVPPKASPGHVLIIDPLGQISQEMLSVKHVLSNVIALILDIDKYAAKYIKLHDENKFVVMLRKELNFEKMYLRVAHAEARYLSDLDRVDDAGNINVTAISDISQMAIITRGDLGQNADICVIDTAVSGVGSCFTPEALRYIKDTGWNIVGDSIEFDLSGWDHEQPLLVTKRVSKDVKETLNQFKAFIDPAKSHKKSAKRLIPKNILECETVSEAISELHELLNLRLNVSYVQVEMFIKALMSKPNSWLFPKGNEDFRFITLDESLRNRSGFISLGYERQCMYVANPSTFLKDKNTVPPHEMDGLFATGLGFSLDN